MKNRILLLFILMATFSVSAQNTDALFSVQVGDYQIYLLSEGQGSGNTGILIGATPEMIAEQIPDSTFPTASNAFLIRTPDKNILVDTGYGKLLYDNLQSAGLQPDQIDVVLITHEHGDHIGGLLKDGQPLFPNAQIYISQPEQDYWLGVKNALVEKITQAYGKQLVLFQPNKPGEMSIALFPGIIPVATYGHTPGHTSYWIQSAGQQLLIWGDLAHAMAIQMPYPQVAVTYDVDPEEAVRTREAILQWVSEQQIPIAGMHIAYPGIGNIQPAGKGYEFVPAF